MSQAFLELELELSYPGVLPSSLYPDPHKTVACTLHFEMRTGESITHHVLSHTLRVKHPDAFARLLAAQAAIRARPGLDWFTLKIDKKPIGEIKDGSSILSKSLDSISLSRKHANELVRELADHALPCLIRPCDTPSDGGADPLPLWRTALTQYVIAVNVLRKVPTAQEKVLGDEGYEEQLDLDATIIQTAADRCTNALVELLSDTCLTNYLHLFRAGHFAEMMRRHGYLCYLNNQAVEYVNGVVSCVYHRHSQMGGASGQSQGHGQRLGDHTDGVRKWSLCHVAWASGDAEEALCAEYSLEALAANRARSGANLAGNSAHRFRGGRKKKDEYRAAHTVKSGERIADRAKRPIGSVVLGASSRSNIPSALQMCINAANATLWC